MKHGAENSNLRQGNVVLVDVPYTDLSGSKIRPALIVSNETVHTLSPDMLVVPLTSIVRKSQFSIALSDSDLIRGKLFLDSEILINKIICLEKSITTKNIATISSSKLEQVIHAIRSLF
ncbi:MAG: type II toxin-antitoxin system PemK/MazF family toxin [Candidatus Woesearchaeota archaeon]